MIFFGFPWFWKVAKGRKEALVEAWRPIIPGKWGQEGHRGGQEGGPGEALGPKTRFRRSQCRTMEVKRGSWGGLGEAKEVLGQLLNNFLAPRRGLGDDQEKQNFETPRTEQKRAGVRFLWFLQHFYKCT